MIFHSSIPESFLKDFFDINSSFLKDLEDMYHYQGWVNFFDDIDINKTQKELEKLSTDVDYILSIGVGGSYMGVQALVSFTQQEDKWLFLGPSLDPAEVDGILQKIKNKKVGVLVISKSGTTFEVNLFLKLCKKMMQNAKWVATITSNSEFSLKVADFLGREIHNYTIEEKTGGRYSVFSMMGLITLHLLNQDWKKIVTAMKKEKKDFLENIYSHAIFKRGIGRYLLQNLYGVNLEVLSTKDRRLKYTIKWLEQLFAESDGKAGKGLFISRAFYPQDAHSIGQIMTSGKRIVSETFYLLEAASKNEELMFDICDGGSSRGIEDIADIFIQSIIEDRSKHMVVQSYIIPDNLEGLFKLFFCAMMSVTLECYLLKVNPFDQPGVEGYKKNIKAKLEKNG